MSFRSASAFFARLIPSIISDLRRIASRSRGETTVEDLQAEAWLVADELSRDRDPPPDAGDKGFHQQILGRLYNRFVKFADKRFRFAVRLDEQRDDDDGGTFENPVLAALEAPAAYEPTQALELREEELAREIQMRGRFAEAVAYLRVFDAMKQDRRAIADRLAIAVCTLRRRMHRAARMVEQQPSLFDGVTVISGDFIPPQRARKCCGESTLQDGSKSTVQARLFPRAYVPLRRL
ncbi:hypothetical protein [Cupriavidus sp. PET2-C1]